MKRKPYPSDLTDAEWKIIEPLLPCANPIGTPPQVEKREILDAIFYWSDNGIKWRAMPHDLPKWQTVYGYFARWVNWGVWEQINAALNRQVRAKVQRNLQASLAMVDSQSVEMSQTGGPEHGVDGFKRVKGRKRHIVVDVLGCVLDCFVSAANMADVKAAPGVLVPALEANPRIRKILADQSYRGDIAKLLKTAYKCTLEITQRLGEGFVVEPWRWVVERTFGWLENARRLCRDYEALPEHHEGIIYITMIRLMLRRLTNNRRTRLT